MNEIKPIRTEAEHDAAVDEIDELMEAEEGTPEADRLEVLAILVDAYETANDPIAPPNPIDAILFALDQEQITKKQLELALGGRNRMSEVLARRRGLSIGMIRELANLGLPLRSLVGATRLSPPKKAARKAKRGTKASTSKPRCRRLHGEGGSTVGRKNPGAVRRRL